MSQYVSEFSGEERKPRFDLYSVQPAFFPHIQKHNLGMEGFFSGRLSIH